MLIDEPDSGPSRIGGRGPYLKIGAVFLVAASVLALGYLGPRVPSKSAAPSASVAAPTAPRPHATDLAAVETAMGMRLVESPAGEVQSLLPLQITTSPAIAGNRLFFVVSGTMLESSDVGSEVDPVTLVRVAGCQEINQLAAAGNAVMYLVTSPDPPATTAACGTYSRIHWSLQLLDLSTGKSREVAAGTRPKVAPAVDGFPIHFAMTATSYAFDRPEDETAARGPETIQVRKLDGTLLWTARSGGHVVQLELGESQTLAVATADSWPAGGTRTVWIADPRNQTLQRMGETHSFFSVSPDGRYVVWDTTLEMGTGPTVPTADVAIADMLHGAIRSAFPSGGKEQIEARSPAVLTTSSGPFIAWLSLGPDLNVYPSFNWPERGRSGFLKSTQQPLWIAATADSLVWLAISPDGWSSVIYSVALDSL